MPYYYGYGFGIDPLYLLVVLVCTVLGLAAQSYINSMRHYVQHRIP